MLYVSRFDARRQSFQSYSSRSATMPAVGRFPTRSESPATQSRAALRPATALVIPWLVRNTLRNVGAARPSKPEARLRLLPSVTWYALATAQSIAAVRIVSTSTITLVLPRPHLQLHPHPVQMLSPRSPVSLGTGPITDAGRES